MLKIKHFIKEGQIMKILKNKNFLIAVSIVLVVAILFTSGIGIILNITAGEDIDCEAEVNSYNTQKVTYSNLTTGVSEDVLSAELDDLDAKLAAILTSVNLESVLYTDAVATLVTKFTAELTQKSFDTIKFSDLKKDFPAAYEYVTAQQEAGMTWEGIGTIPFGITAGDKEMFIKACGAGAAHMGETLLEVVLCAPSSYYDALVPALEATHTEKMPSLFGFVAKTGLSNSKRIEFMVERILAIIEPIKQAPLTYLCSIVPDFIINYNKACEFINGNEKIAEKAKLTLPTIDSIIQQFISALGMTAPAVDYDYLSKTGTASVSESGGNGGARVQINGDREVVFAYLADFITGLFTYENNFTVVEKILTETLKSEAVQSSPFAAILTSEAANSMIAALVDILAKLKPRDTVDVNAQIEAYNAETKDFSNLFTWPATEENVASVLDSVEVKISEALVNANLESIIFTDSFATTVAKLTAKLCGKELSDLSFAALKKSFPAAYEYVKAEQAAGRTWADIDKIPFGITDGDKDMFVKACGAGAEHFGDALALCLLVDPHLYDEALVPLLESLHTGPMPALEQFVSCQGLDGAKRMEDIVTKVLTITEPLKASPIAYLTEILPDLINSYNKAAEAIGSNAVSPLRLPDISSLLNDIVSSMGLVLPEHDFSSFTKMATAYVAESGTPEGQRMELKGDRETVFMGLATYVMGILNYGDNNAIISNLLSNVLGIETAVFSALIGLFG